MAKFGMSVSDLGYAPVPNIIALVQMHLVWNNTFQIQYQDCL